MKKLLTLLGLKPKEVDREPVNPVRWPPAAPRVAATVNAMCRDARPGQKVTSLDQWNALLQEPQQFQVEVAVHAAQRMWGLGGLEGAVEWDAGVHDQLTRQLLRRDLPFTDEHIAYFLALAANEKAVSYGFPFNDVLTAVARHVHGRPPGAKLREALETFRGRVKDGWEHTSAGRKMITRVDALLDPPPDPALVVPKDAWDQLAGSWSEDLKPDRRDAWIALFAFAATSDGKSKPTKKWLAQSAPMLDQVGRDEVLERLLEWLADSTPVYLLSDGSQAILKGLIWATIHLDHRSVAAPIGRYAEKCFKKVPDIGPGSPKLGNACLIALSQMGDVDEAAAELVRLKTRVKYATVRGRVDDRIGAMAEEAGVSAVDLEETALPRFDLDADGRVETMLGEAVATIALGDEGATLSWRGAGNKPRKSVPVAVRRDFAAELKALKRRVKDINDARTVQTRRIEATWIEDRDWPFDVWKERYLEHPVRRPLSRALIWRFDGPTGVFEAMPTVDGFCSSSGGRMDIHPDSRVRLWHPIDSTTGEIMAWRRAISRMEITQPISQAHREIYVLTDAERETRTYSNRFAAHILRQHQFRALCHARGWKYEFQGGWDNWNVPTRLVPQRDLAIQYTVDPVEDGAETEMGIPLHVASDQVRFLNGSNETIDLADLHPVLFSEAMRDVDLFVAVTSVANDPAWTDGGPEGRYGAYWREHAFGDLGETGKTRRNLVAEIAPKLAIADRLNVTEKYLEVRGNLNSYRIHLGSANIQILPDNRYLCIVRAAKGPQTIRLPFAGDSLLSIILSKAFLLAADDKITDPTILSQLQR